MERGFRGEVARINETLYSPDCLYPISTKRAITNASIHTVRIPNRRDVA
jgi:hypothetical protein